MGTKFSLLEPNQNDTASDLYVKESTAKGLQVIGALSTSIICSPVIVIALPFIGAYEFGTALEHELLTGHKIADGALGVLFGITLSPLGPFYYFLLSMQKIFSTTHQFSYLQSISASELLLKAQEQFGLNTEHYNVVLTGCSGTGKSSVLNGLLGYKENHMKAAAVGEIETTLEPKKYQHPSLPALYLWDMPGVGTLRNPSKSYFEDYCLNAFDAILIVFDDRFMASDVDIARKARRHDIPVFFIRNKADISIERKMQRMNNKSKKPIDLWASAVSQLIIQIRGTVYRDMQNLGLDIHQLYIVSAHTLTDLVLILKDQRQTNHHKQTIIHEKVLITNLLETIAASKQHN